MSVAQVRKLQGFVTIRTDGCIVVIKPVHVVRDLEVYIDDELTMKQHVGKIAGFYHLRLLRQIRCHISNELMAQLIYAFVTSRLDYCNSVLTC